MTRNWYILSFILWGLTSCVSSQLSIDDAYHWEDKTASTTTSSASSATSSTSTSKPVKVSSGSTVIVAPAGTKIVTSSASQTTSTPTLEFINVQDTTITVRIKR